MRCRWLAVRTRVVRAERQLDRGIRWGSGIVTTVSASAVLGAVLLILAAVLITVGLLGWLRRLPRNRFAGVRTPATLRSEAAFVVANRVAAAPVLAAGAISAAGGGLALGAEGPVLAVIVAVAGAGSIGLTLAGGLLGHRVAAALPRPAGGCAECSCGGRGCSWGAD